VLSRTLGYLRRLGIQEPLPPTLDSLLRLHRAHLDRVPYENLMIMLGRPPSVDADACLQRVGEFGRAGYCFHQNSALELVLRDLGYDVERRHGNVWTGEPAREGMLNHLALVVSGLPSPDNPGGRWWPDVGLGEGFRDPLPLVTGVHREGPFSYRVEVSERGWSFRNDGTGSFTGIEVSSRPTEPAAVLAAHAQLSTPPQGRFTRLLVVQRRDESGVDTVRGCVHSRVDEGGRDEADLPTYAAWREALVGLGLALGDIDDMELRALWERMWESHQQWDAAGRP